MKRLFLIQFSTLLTFISFGQIKPIDLTEIKNISKADTYNNLFIRFIANDTTLMLNDYLVIYYGQAFRDDYKPNARHDSVKVLNKYLNSNNIGSIDFHKVLNYTKLILKEYPFNIEQVYVGAIAYDKLGLVDSSKIWFYKYENLIKTILSSGDGKSQKTAFIVTKVTDEYSILNALGLQFAGQSLINKKKKYYDLMSVSQNDYGIEDLYFDINLFFRKWD
jgi:hypothetical protein